jgi:hypothetical protein
MTSLGRRLRSTALLLLVTAAACGESPAEFEAKAARQGAASPNEKEPDGTAVVAAPVRTLEKKLGTSTELIEHMPPGFTPPPGQFYGFALTATGFPPGKSWEFQTLARFINDGRVFVEGAGGGGFVPADGTFRTGGAASCPTQYSEMWVVVTVIITDTRRSYESPHWAPPRC